MTQVLHVPAFRDNYIWLLLDETGSGLVAVDPGDAGPVLGFMQQHGLRLNAILCTHHHRDHSGGIAALCAPERQRVPVFGPAREAIPGLTHPVREGDAVRLPGFTHPLSVLDIPGHTAGHVAFFSDRWLFCGDTLFSGGCGRLFEGTAEEMYASLGKLAALPPETEVYCGHEYTLANLRFALSLEPDNASILDYYQKVSARRERGEASLPSTIGRELRINPFLRAGDASLKAVLDQRTGQKSDSAAVRFAILRRWKDEFKG